MQLSIKQIKQEKRKILLGLNKDNEAIILQIDTVGLEANGKDRIHFSIVGDAYDMNQVLDDETGEERAKEYLSDGEQWRAAVEAEQTEDSLEDWNNQVINIDGWQHVIGDMEYIGFDENKNSDLYVNFSSCGQITEHCEKMEKLEITEQDYKKIMNAWRKLHLPEIQYMNDKRKRITEKKIDQINSIVDIFRSYDKYEGEQLMKYVNKEESD